MTQQNRGLVELLDLSPDAPKQYAAGRVCLHRGCKTVLSVYSGEPFCWVHRHDMPDYGMPKKVCSKCGVTKHATEAFFRRDSRKVDGLKSACRECCTAMDKARYQAAPDKWREQRNERNRNRRKAAKSS